LKDYIKAKREALDLIFNRGWTYSQLTEHFKAQGIDYEQIAQRMDTDLSDGETMTEAKELLDQSEVTA